MKHRMLYAWIISAISLVFSLSSHATRGNATFGGACNADDVHMLQVALGYGRIASGSAAFEQCLQREMPTYIPCIGDPPEISSPSVPLSVRVQRILDLSRGENEWQINCTGGVGGHASAINGTYGTTAALRVDWDRNQLTEFLNLQGDQVCANLLELNCRYPNDPYMQTAATLWHEAMHNHGLRHAFDQVGSNTCGHINVEASAVKIVQRCMMEVLTLSGFECGDNASCGNRGLEVVSAVPPNTGTCQCLEDTGGVCFDAADQDGDGVGDRCDSCPAQVNTGDADSDTIDDACDNCRDKPNRNQRDTDGDQVGNACDNCIAVANNNQADQDTDTVGDACDNCPAVWNKRQRDLDRDGIGNACDDDIDGDTVLNRFDNCPYDPNPGQQDADNDGVGDACDYCDLVRGLALECRPLQWLRDLMAAMDVRLQAIAEIFAEEGIKGPWGPWKQFQECAWGCEERGVEYQRGREAALKFLKTMGKDRRISEKELMSLLMGEKSGVEVRIGELFRDSRLKRQSLPPNIDPRK